MSEEREIYDKDDLMELLQEAIPLQADTVEVFQLGGGSVSSNNNSAVESNETYFSNMVKNPSQDLSHFSYKGTEYIFCRLSEYESGKFYYAFVSKGKVNEEIKSLGIILEVESQLFILFTVAQPLLNSVNLKMTELLK